MVAKKYHRNIPYDYVGLQEPIKKQLVEVKNEVNFKFKKNWGFQETILFLIKLCKATDTKTQEKIAAEVEEEAKV